MIYSIHPFIDDQGRHVVGRIDTANPLGGYVSFKGQATVTVTPPKGTPGQPMQIPISFDIPAKTVPEAYEQFDTLAKQAADHRIKELEQGMLRRTLAGR